MRTQGKHFSDRTKYSSSFLLLILILAVAVVVAFLIKSIIHAYALENQLVFSNNSQEDVAAVYISSDDSTSWEEDILEGRGLAQGKSVKIGFRYYSSVSGWDMRIVMKSGRAYEYYGYDGGLLRLGSTITLQRKGEITISSSGGNSVISPDVTA